MKEIHYEFSFLDLLVNDRLAGFGVVNLFSRASKPVGNFSRVVVKHFQTNWVIFVVVGGRYVACCQSERVALVKQIFILVVVQVDAFYVS